MSTFPLKPTHKPVKAYFEALATFQKHGHNTEGRKAHILNAVYEKFFQRFNTKQPTPETSFTPPHPFADRLLFSAYGFTVSR